MPKSGFNTKAYFDKKAVIDAVGKAEAKVMGRKGSLVRQIMHRMLNKKGTKGKRHAPPGQPPLKHQGNLAKVEFAFDPKTHSVVIGPAKLGNGKAPEIQDKGGVVEVSGIVTRKGKFVPLYVMDARGRQAAIASGKVVKVKAKVEARPFSQPALEKALPLLAKPWKGAVKK